MKFIIIGLPRSGTTILSNYINSSDKAFCFLEPHWEYTQHQTTNFFNDDKLKRLFFLKYRKNESLPLDSAINRIEKRYEYTGFKETYRSDVYHTYDKNLPNSKLLQRYLDNNYILIPIVRDPLRIWDSFKRSTPSKSSWASNLNAFISCYCEFINLIGNSTPVIYEHFTQNPKKELDLKTTLKLEVITKIIDRKVKMGDAQANKSSRIKNSNQKTLATAEEENIINRSQAFHLYQTISKTN